MADNSTSTGTDEQPQPHPWFGTPTYPRSLVAFDEFLAEFDALLDRYNPVLEETADVHGVCGS